MDADRKGLPHRIPAYPVLNHEAGGRPAAVGATILEFRKLEDPGREQRAHGQRGHQPKHNA